MSCRYSGDLPIKEIQVKSAEVSEKDILIQLYDYTEAYPEEELFLKGQKIYFIEGSISALTIIPIQLTENQMHIHMELLDRSPEFINDIWWGRHKKKSIADLPFLKPSEWKNKKNS